MYLWTAKQNGKVEKSVTTKIWKWVILFNLLAQTSRSTLIKQPPVNQKPPFLLNPHRTLVSSLAFKYILKYLACSPMSVWSPLRVLRVTKAGGMLNLKCEGKCGWIFVYLREHSNELATNARSTASNVAWDRLQNPHNLIKNKQNRKFMDGFSWFPDFINNQINKTF